MKMRTQIGKNTAYIPIRNYSQSGNIINEVLKNHPVPWICLIYWTLLKNKSKEAAKMVPLQRGFRVSQDVVWCIIHTNVGISILIILMERKLVSNYSICLIFQVIRQSFLLYMYLCQRLLKLGSSFLYVPLFTFLEVVFIQRFHCNYF